MLIRIKEITAKGMISSMYKILLKLDDTAFDGKIIKWSEHGKIPITQDIWSNINNSYIVSTSVLSIKMLFIKLLNRWYVTSKKLHCIDPSFSPNCWKGCMQSANYIHCWWECAVVCNFWKLVRNQIKLIWGIEIPFIPESFLLYLGESQNIPSWNRQTVTI